MLASIMPSVGNIDEVNIAILHQFTELSLVLTLGDSLGHTIVHQTFHLTVDIVCVALVTETNIYILS